MWNRRSIVAFAVLLAVLAGGFFMPDYVTGLIDKNTLGKLIETDSTSVSLGQNSNLALTDRLALIANSSTGELELKKGKAMDFATALSRAQSELKKLISNNVYEFDYDNCYAEGGAAVFVIDSDDPSINMIVWRFELRDLKGRFARLVIDDETGVILQLIYGQTFLTSSVTSGESGPGVSYNDAKLVAEMMDAYYELPVALAEYELIGGLGYYKAEIGVTDLVPMFGIVRETGFSINERHSL